MNSFYKEALSQSFGREVSVQSATPIGGGCINNGLKLMTSEGIFFMKWQTGIPGDMFEKEARGLKLLATAGAVPVPEPIAWGKVQGKHYFLMEFIDSAPKTRDYWKTFGHDLALLHLQNTAASYGLDHDNYIGKLPQPNRAHENWIDFFIENRLEFQLKLAMDNGLVSGSFIDRYRKFYEKLPDLLPVDRPALLHGDLWSGNVMTGSDGRACIIDPAVYYGHREIELAFTQMFGSFPGDFYAAYRETYPLEPGYEERVDIYNIYPHMTHTNLFGPSYLGGVEQVLRRYV